MNFLIMTRLPEIYSSQRLVQEIKARGHQVQTINPEVAWPEHAESKSADLVIPRLGGFRYPEALAQFTAMEKRFPETCVLNPSGPFQKARHKKHAHKILHALPQPALYETPKTFPVIVKDCLSSKGEGVFLCHSQEELDKCLYKLQGREILFQEYIPECAGHDVRAFVIGTRVTASMERKADPLGNDFRANLALGGTAVETELSAHERKLCLSATKQLGLDYAGVDFVRADRGPLILEVNPCPGFEGIEKCTRANVAQEVVLYAERLFNSYS